VKALHPRLQKSGGVREPHDVSLTSVTEKLIRGLIDETRAEIILPLGGALIPYVVNPDDLAKATGVQVLNTKAIGIRFAEMCVAIGMTQSALTYPRAKMTYQDFTNRS
jgi:DNA-binding transcriptional ArsR family regulator